MRHMLLWQGKIVRKPPGDSLRSLKFLVSARQESEPTDQSSEFLMFSQGCEMVLSHSRRSHHFQDYRKALNEVASGL